MPKLGVDMQEGEIIEWKKQEGDVVNEGDILLEIMSDKTNMELEAEDSGVLLKITRQAGETVPVTEVIGYIGAEGEVVADNAAISPAAEAAPQVEKVADVEKQLLNWKRLGLKSLKLHLNHLQRQQKKQPLLITNMISLLLVVVQLVTMQPSVEHNLAVRLPSLKNQNLVEHV